MVDNDLRPLTKIMARNTRVSFFAILKMDEYTDKWSLLLSGSDLSDTDKKKKLFEDVIPLIYKNDSPIDKSEIARIGIFPLSNHLVKEIRKHPAGSHIKLERANGNFIHEGYILINKRLRH